MRAERIVLDTNVLISAALSSKGNPAICLDWVVKNASLLTSAELLDEFETRLARPKFARYMNDVKRRTFMASLVQAAIPIQWTMSISVCRDPDDDKVLEIAVAGRADCIVTGDQDLLVLNPFQGIPILTPAAFLAAIADPP